ncbi:MAG: hypothetical protein ACREHG_11275 [Candidatus Saccharimonadales bacterium]
MATISKQDDKIVIKLSDIEKVETVRGGFKLPLQSVNKVEVIEDPIKEVHGLKPNHAKLYGMYLPGESAVGVFLAGGLKEEPAFIAIHHNNKRGVRITLDNAKYSELLIGCNNPEEIAQLLNYRLKG